MRIPQTEMNVWWAIKTLGGSLRALRSNWKFMNGCKLIKLLTTLISCYRPFSFCTFGGAARIWTFRMRGKTLRVHRTSFKLSNNFASWYHLLVGKFSSIPRFSFWQTLLTLVMNIVISTINSFCYFATSLNVLYGSGNWSCCNCTLSQAVRETFLPV